MELELSRICNLRCIYCYAEAGEKLENELSYAEIQDAVDQAVGLGARRIIVLGGGEPLAYPRIMDVLRSLHERGLGIDLFTNTTLITPEMAREFFAMGVNPVVKLNSMRADIQDKLAGCRGAFDDIQKGFAALREAGYPTKELPLGVQTVICGQNLDELPEMWTWIREQGMTPYFEMITMQGRARKHRSLNVTLEQMRELFDKLSQIDRERFGLEWAPHPPIAGLCCQRHAYTCTVTVTGDVLPCPGVNIPVGNIREKSLKDILAQSTVIKDLRNIRETIKGKCRECEHRLECYGCRGMAYQATGDYLAEDPLCWKEME